MLVCMCVCLLILVAPHYLLKNKLQKYTLRYGRAEITHNNKCLGLRVCVCACGAYIFAQSILFIFTCSSLPAFPSCADLEQL